MHQMILQHVPTSKEIRSLKGIFTYQPKASTSLSGKKYVEEVRAAVEEW